jgi:hypothetical protein
VELTFDKTHLVSENDPPPLAGEIRPRPISNSDPAQQRRYSKLGGLDHDYGLMA